jgi:general secretion pathway protein D
MSQSNARRALLILAAALLPLLAGCAADRMRSEGIQLIEQGRIEEGLAKLEEAAREAPTQAQYRATLGTARERATSQLNAAGERALAADNLAEAETLFRRVLAISSSRARRNSRRATRIPRHGSPKRRWRSTRGTPARSSCAPRSTTRSSRRGSPTRR